LLKHLVEQEKIPRERIAVVTGDQKELDGINLFALDCSIDFVFTVEALKEGWDCSFAYVFCSVATVNSKKDVEQILGRVLRMPYAKRRKDAELNRAYAHVSRASWPNAVKQLHDRLVDMGFEDSEADAFIEKVPQLGLNGGAGHSLFAEAPPPTILDLAEDLTSFSMSHEEQAVVAIVKTEHGSRVTLTGHVAEATITRYGGGRNSAAFLFLAARNVGEAMVELHRLLWCLERAGTLAHSRRTEIIRNAADRDDQRVIA
jgi:type III restriction enzyme